MHKLLMTTTTGRIWRALNRPPGTHPLFQRVVLMPGEKRRFASWAGVIITLVVGMGEHIPTLLLFLMPVLLFFTGIIYGVDCALRVSTAIAREHEHDTFTLLAMSPDGALGTSWAICTSALYRHREFDTFHTIVRTSVIIALVVIGIVGSISILWQSAVISRTPQPVMLTVMMYVNLGVTFTAVYLEYIQSTVLGCLVGMLIPTYARNRLDAMIFALGSFLLLQITSYLITMLIGFAFLPGFFHSIGIQDFTAEFSLTFIRLGLFFAVREVILLVAWRTLLLRLNAVSNELEPLMRPALY